jgi:predicted nucleic acid-binding Zn ribbon protein
MTPTPTAAPTSSAGEPLHGCVRCGRPIPLGDSMCDHCNPLGLSQPSATQVHGIAFVGLVVAVIMLALLGSLALTGIGPFAGEVTGVAGDASGLVVTLTVRNDGERTGSTTCRIYDPAVGGITPGDHFVQSPRVEGGSSVTFTELVTTLGTEVRPLAAACR